MIIFASVLAVSSCVVLVVLDKVKVRNDTEAMLEINTRYGINLTHKELQVLRGYEYWKNAFSIIEKPKYVGPRGDSSIDLEFRGETIPVFLNTEDKQWVLVSKGQKLPTIAEYNQHP